jgi:hypothetical protein
LDEYVCVTISSRSGESQAEFSNRLSQFWTHLLRNRLNDFEMVYAESTGFEKRGEQWSRKYLVEAGVIETLMAELSGAKICFDPIDPDDTYTKYEAVAPEWMQIEH